MENLKRMKLPNWIIRTIHAGKEDEELSSIIVNCGVFYIIGVVCYFMFNPFSGKHLWVEITICIAVIIVLIAFIFWLTRQVAFLYLLRKEAFIMLKNAKTEKEFKDAMQNMQDLCTTTNDSNLYS